MVETLAFIFGICIGSFLNVCIFRLPEGRSIVHPASACMACARPIRWYDNIPVLSYILLRGRCRRCGSRFSVRYPLVELMTGLLAAALCRRFGCSFEAGVYFVFAAALTVVTFIDIDHRIIPDIITLPGIPLGLAAAFGPTQLGWPDALFGILCGGGSLLAVAWLYRLMTGKEGMGGGDIKLLAMIGAFVGWKGVLLTIFTASAVGTFTGLLLMVRLKKNMKLAIPFGPFLAIGAMLHLFFGEAIIAWYLGGM